MFGCSVSAVQRLNNLKISNGKRKKSDDILHFTEVWKFVTTRVGLLVWSLIIMNWMTVNFPVVGGDH